MRFVSTYAGLFALAILRALGLDANAADLPAPLAYAAPPAVGAGFLSELRGGLLAHNPAGRESGSVDANFEILLVKPFVPADPVMAFFVPRLHVGTTISTAGDTSSVYAGFTWSYDFTNRLFGELSFGAGFNNGKTGTAVPGDRIALAARLSFANPPRSVTASTQTGTSWRRSSISPMPVSATATRA